MPKKKKIKAPNLARMCYDAAYAMLHHDGMELAGYLTFLGLLAFFPFLVFLVSLAGFFGDSQLGAQFVGIIMAYLPADFIQALAPRIREIISGPPQGLLTLAIVGTVWTASSAVEGLRMVLNRAYHVETPPTFVWRRMISILELIGLTFIIITAMLFMTFIPAIWGVIEDKLPIAKSVLDPTLTYLRYGLSALTLFGAVAASYYVLPNLRQRFVTVAPGALLVVVLWMLGAELFSLYLTLFGQVSLVYGSLGGIIVAMLFIYIVAVIYIWGAEFNYQVVKRLGLHLSEKEKTRRARST